MNINEYEQYVGEEEEFSIKDILFHILYHSLFLLINLFSLLYLVLW